MKWWWMIACLALGCGGTSQTKEPSQASSLSRKNPPPRPLKHAPITFKTGESPEGEIIPISHLPRPLVGEGDAGAPSMSTKKGDIFKQAQEALQRGNPDSALAFVDTLLVLQPDDTELLEFRGIVLMRQGHLEDALFDFERCCTLGRKTCCRWKDPQ